MWIIIAGTVIASMISSALLLASLSVGKRGDDWTEASEPQVSPQKGSYFNKPARHAGPR